MRIFGSLLCVFCLMGVCQLWGCAQSQSDQQLHRIAQTPPDFALELYVDGKIDDPDPRLVRCNYLLEPNFNLHLSLGDEAGRNKYPSRYLKLRHEQFQQLVSVAQQANLMAEPTSPFAENVLKHQQAPVGERPLIHVVVTSWGKTNRYVTTGQDSPPTQVILDRLIRFTGRKLLDEDSANHRGY